MSYITLKPNLDQLSTTKLSLPIKSRTTTPRPTTTTPVITTSTEESEAKLESLQFFAAPLVAAFTVHQDELGVLKSVEPILKIPGQNSVTAKEIENQRLKALEAVERKKAEEKYREEQAKLEQYLRSQEQIRLQKELEAKQKALQEQIKTLQKQKQEQEEFLIRQQQFLLEQERQKLHLQSVNPNANFQRFRKPSITVEHALTYQPELHVDNSLQAPTKPHQNFQEIPFTQYQQLPIRGPVDFNTPFANAFSAPVENNNFRQSRPHGNRVFRQETGTGNFVNSDFNTRNNYYSSTFSQSPHSNRFFRSNQNSYSITPSIVQDYHSSRYVRAPFVNNQLNNLLYYSGISNGKQQEDLNIISKVLSYNIRGDNYYSGSEPYEHRLLPPRRSFVIES